MTNIPSILKNDQPLTPYRFYTDFLEDVAKYYKQPSKNVIAFRLFEKGDEEIFTTNYRIDPIAIPLLLSLFEQLSKFHKTPLELYLYNNHATIDVLEFLYRCDFFFISGDDKFPAIPKGRDILRFDRDFLGAFSGKKIRNEHKVRAYSRDDDGVKSIFKLGHSEEKIRDHLISLYTYKVREHFEELLFDNPNTLENHNLFVDILSELITNSVLYSKSTAFALMFVDRYKTKFSISDNGVGFSTSMKEKKVTPFYRVDVLKDFLIQRLKFKFLPKPILDNLYTIFDTLYYSSLKDRHGLFDLMIAVVLNGKGYFRIHCENSQIIISNRMMNELGLLNSIRLAIYEIHVEYELKKISREEWESQMLQYCEKMLQGFEVFCCKSLEKYSSDIRYSSIRFYPVKFRGVHIEVEIPNSTDNDNISN